MLDAQAVAPTAGEGGAMDDGVGGTEEAEQELLAALTPVEENKATDGENPPTWIGTGFQRKPPQCLRQRAPASASEHLLTGSA